MEKILPQKKHRAVYRNRSRVQDDKVEGSYRDRLGGRVLHSSGYGETKGTPVASSNVLDKHSNPPGGKLFQDICLLNTSDLVRHISSALSTLCPLSTIQITPQFIKVVLFLSIITPVLADGGGDNFANNLFSDLAPILALFGEQVAKQFLSESTGLADNLLFAMAPLGIITAIVSAIRVAGFPWLKAVVGRGKEGQGQVELELMSSNSLDVGEMWNGQAVVRVVGTPSVFQLIYDPKTAISNPTEGIDVLRNGNPFFTRVSKGNRSSVNQGGAPEPPDWNEQESIELDILWDENYDTELGHPLIPASANNSPHESNLSPPNISLNARGEPVTKFEKWLYASVGVILQMVVLIYGGVISYHPTWKKNPNFLKEGISPSREAFPCTAVGTVSLNLGMFICAYVIDRASTEEKWMIKGNQKSQVAWVQKGGTVNDQVFEPYIILGHQGQKVIRTSHRCSTATTASLKFLVLLGTLVSIFGFVIQFIGLRGMTWSATIAQLVATAIMTALRLVVRRRLIKEPIAELAVEGYELEYMARKIGGCSDWRVVSRYLTVEDGLEKIGRTKSGGEGAESDSEGAGSGGEGGGVGSGGERMVVDEKLAGKVLEICKRLGTLSQWSMDVENISRSLCNAMEQTLTTIFRSKQFVLRDGASQKLKFTWGLTVRSFENKKCDMGCTTLTFELDRLQTWAAWEVTKESRHGIKCVLSLWMLHLLEKERKYRHGRQRTATTLEEGVLSHFEGIVRVLSWPTHPIDHEIARLWLGRGLDIRVGNPKTISQVEKVPRHRFIGIADHPGDTSILAVIPDTSIGKHLGQDLFSQFFSAVVPLIDEINGTTTTHEYQEEIEQFENTALSEIVEVLFQTGLGTRPEILLGIIPHLGNQQLLLMHQPKPGTPFWYSRIDCRHRRLRLGHLWLDIALNIKELLRDSSKTITAGDKYAISQIAWRFRKQILALATPCDNESSDRGSRRKRLISYLEACAEHDPQLAVGRPRPKELVPAEIIEKGHYKTRHILEAMLDICCGELEPVEDTQEREVLGRVLGSNTSNRNELVERLRKAAQMAMIQW